MPCPCCQQHEAENERLRASMARIGRHVARALAEPAHLDTGELVQVMDELDALDDPYQPEAPEIVS